MTSATAAVAVEMDVTEQDSIDAPSRKLSRSLGRIDILINNAALFTAAPIVEIARADYDRVFAINVAGSLFTMQAVARHMIEAGHQGQHHQHGLARRDGGASRWSRSIARRRPPSSV